MSEALDRQRPVRILCKKCRKIDPFELPARGFRALSRGKSHEVSFPGADPARIRELREQICPACRALIDAEREKK
jgi:hypothetical protein